ncbi:MAG: WHG domain-containing protein [Nocardioides sp.]
MGTLREPTRRERQRESTFDEIVSASRALLADGADLSLRAVAGRMGITAPALYRYVASYQELVDLVAFEIDKAATVTFRAAADRMPEDDPGGRLIAASTEFRCWALASPREFGLVFANPVADSNCLRREQLTLASSGHLYTGLMRTLWEHNHHPIPRLDELPPAIRESVVDPMIPAEVDGIDPADHGLLWVFMQGWTQLYGVVALEVFGHLDPRVIASGEMFIDSLRHFAPRIGLAADWPRLEALVRERLAAVPAPAS